MKPKVVVMASRFPFPLIKGDKLRLYNQIKYLSKTFDIYLICINEKWPESQDLEEINKYCFSISIHLLHSWRSRLNTVFNYFSNIPMQVRYFYDRHIHEKIKNEIHLIEPDHIFFHLIRMAPYAVGLERRYSKSLDFMDSMALNDLADQYLGQYFFKIFRARERRLIKKYESTVFTLFNHHFVISYRDKAHFNTDVNANLTVLSNGVDSEYFKPETAIYDRLTDIIFCGNLSYRPNLEAIHYIIEEVYPLLGDRSVLIAGAEMANTQREGINSLLKQLGYQSIQIKGFKEDIRDIYRRGKIMIVPIFSGSGQQNKVLEAMACGTPCIVTNFVNEGIMAEVGREILTADDAKSFVKHINDLLSHPEKWRLISESGRQFVKETFNWEKNTSVLNDTISKDIING